MTPTKAGTRSTVSRVLGDIWCKLGTSFTSEPARDVVALWRHFSAAIQLCFVRCRQWRTLTQLCCNATINTTFAHAWSALRWARRSGEGDAQDPLRMSARSQIFTPPPAPVTGGRYCFWGTTNVGPSVAAWFCPWVRPPTYFRIDTSKLVREWTVASASKRKTTPPGKPHAILWSCLLRSLYRHIIWRHQPYRQKTHKNTIQK